MPETSRAFLTAAAATGNPVIRFLEALGRADFDHLESCFTRDVWLRALLPRSIHESATAGDAVAALRSWFEVPGGTRLLESEHHTMAGREHVRYRFVLQPPWAQDDWHVIEQTGFCRIKENRISRLDIVCTGFFPANERGEPRPF